MDGPRKRRGSLPVEHREEISENEGDDFDYVETNDDLSNISSAQNILSMERLKLSLDDRNAIEEEIHGVRCRAVEETVEFNQQSLQAFQNKLQSEWTSGKHPQTVPVFSFLPSKTLITD